MCHTCQTSVPMTPVKQKPRFGTADGLSRSQKWLGACGPNARLISESIPYEVQGMALVPNIRTWIGLSEDVVTFTQGWGGGVADQIRIPISEISSITVGGAGNFVTSQPGGVFAIGSGADGLMEAIAVSAVANSIIGIASTQQQRETLITITLPRRAVALVNRSTEPVALTTWFAPLQRRTAEQARPTNQPPSTDHVAHHHVAHHVERFEAIRLLLESGAITAEEYETKRAKLLEDI